MPLQKILFKPGVNRENTRYTTEGGWYDGDKIRFRQGNPEKIGGWVRFSANTFLGVCRSLWNWITLAGQNLIGVGTNLKFYIQNGGAYYDITPIRKTSTLTNPFSVTPPNNIGAWGYLTWGADVWGGSPTITNNIVTITDNAHGATNGSYITIYYSGAAPTVGGLTIPTGEYVITYLSANTYTITVSGIATSTATGGGTVYISYQTNVGPAYQAPLVGWGAGAWGAETWGNGGTSPTSIQFWSQQNFGQDLIYGPSGSSLYYWNASIGYEPIPINSITIGSPAVITTYVGLINGTAITLDTSGYLPTGLIPGTVYYVVNSTAGLGLSATVPIGGVSASGGVSSPIIDGVPVTVSITGISAAGAVGYADAPGTIHISGVSASGIVNAANSTGLPVTVSLTGVSASGYVNTFGTTQTLVQTEFTCNLSAIYSGYPINTSGAQSGTHTVSPRGIPVSKLNGVNPVDVPLYQNLMLISDTSRFVILFGTNDYGSAILDPMVIRWSDQESVTQWTPTATTQAGSIRLSHGSRIISAVQARQEIVVFTDASVYSLQYLGPPYIWGSQLLGNNISIMGTNAAVLASGRVYWMGVDKFYMYDGRVQTLNCDLRRYVFQNINQSQPQQVFASTNEGFNEVWWFYCSANSTSIDKYVIYNYLENTWYYGTLARTAWLDSGLQPYPVAATYNGLLVNHEAGVDNNETGTPVAINAYVSSSEFDIGDGHNFGFVWRVLPDLTFTGSTTGTTAETIMTLYPLQNSGSGVGTAGSDNVQSNSTYNITEEFTGQVYTRVRGRQMIFKMESNKIGTTWQLGAPRIDIRPDGRR
jgi:hypothetical protein